MSKINFKLLLKKYINLKIIFTISLSTIPSLILILVFVYGINKMWFDGMSVSALIYICLGILIIVFDIAKFDTWNKFKNLFAIKKENKEKLTKFEKTQMTVLGIKDVDEEKEIRRKETKNLVKALSIFLILYGIILMCISLPFVFINL